MSAASSTPSPLATQLIPRLTRLYGADRASAIATELATRVGAPLPARPGWSARDALLITYGDSLLRPGERPLQTLTKFLRERVGDAISGVHVLPFFPSSSDGGFSVIDYREVDPALGDWNDIDDLARDYDLMADLVLNHVSAESVWFKQFLAGEAPGKDYFIALDPATDVSEVVRPRVKPLLTQVKTVDGDRFVWATFSDDQIDLNFANPDVLVEIIDVLVGYLRHGARYVRLDAVAFLWKRLGTGCIHLNETHEVVRLMRDVVDYVAPGAVLISETNVPHAENVSYFGRSDEAQVVYQFALPPLMLHALHTGDATCLTRWAEALQPPPDGCTFLNFTASHDGIGLRPVEGLLPEEAIEALVEGMRRFGGYVSSRAKSDGSHGYYEINITYFDALMGTQRGRDQLQMPRFLCSQLLALSLRGLPALYIHCLTATRNDQEAVDREGQLRAINRHRWDADALAAALDDPDSLPHDAFHELKHALGVRKEQDAFHPDAAQQVLRLHEGVVALRRVPEEGPTVLVLANVRPEILAVRVPMWALPTPTAHDLLTGKNLHTADGYVELPRYAVMWLTAPSAP